MNLQIYRNALADGSLTQDDVEFLLDEIEDRDYIIEGLKAEIEELTLMNENLCDPEYDFEFYDDEEEDDEY